MAIVSRRETTRRITGTPRDLGVNPGVSAPRSLDDVAFVGPVPAEPGLHAQAAHGAHAPANVLMSRQFVS